MPDERENDASACPPIVQALFAMTKTTLLEHGVEHGYVCVQGLPNGSWVIVAGPAPAPDVAPENGFVGGGGGFGGGGASGSW